MPRILFLFLSLRPADLKGDLHKILMGSSPHSSHFTMHSRTAIAAALALTIFQAFPTPFFSRMKIANSKSSIQFTCFSNGSLHFEGFSHQDTRGQRLYMGDNTLVL